MKLIKNILTVLVPLTLFSGTAFSQTKEELKKKYENSIPIPIMYWTLPSMISILFPLILLYKMTSPTTIHFTFHPLIYP